MPTTLALAGAETRISSGEPASTKAGVRVIAGGWAAAESRGAAMRNAERIWNGRKNGIPFRIAECNLFGIAMIFNGKGFGMELVGCVR